MIRTGIHWIQYTIPAPQLPEKSVRGLTELEISSLSGVLLNKTISRSIETLTHYVPTDFKPAGGMLGYEYQIIGAGGCRILWSNRRAEHHIQLPGKWCDSVHPIEQTCILSEILEQGGHLTRLDIAGDDTDKRVRPKDLETFAESAQLVTHVKRIHLNKDVAGGIGNTIYFGSRSSERILRVYDKDIESGGENDSVRWEIELHNDMADRASEHILNLGIPRAFRECLVSLVDFRQGSDNVTRRKRAEWFQDIVDESEKGDYRIGKPIQTIESMEHWIDKQVSPTLAALAAARGGDVDWLHTLIRSGAERMSDSQKNAVLDYIYNRPSAPVSGATA